MSDRCVVMFTKPARPGRVKTRLIGRLTPEQAAELHAAFVADMVEALDCDRFELRIAWALDEDDALPEGFRVPGIRQRGSDLGERLYRALSEEGEAFEFIAAIGSDHPEIGVADVERAFLELEAGADVVVGPVADGGYYLIALSRARLHPRLFADIAWSTDTVLEATLARCHELGLTVRLLDPGSDVDRPSDLERLRERLRAEPELARRTARLLESWDARPAEASS